MARAKKNLEKVHERGSESEFLKNYKRLYEKFGTMEGEVNMLNDVLNSQT